MLSSIHPLGERARNNRWWITVAAFSLGAMGSGSALGVALGTIGWALPLTRVSTTQVTLTSVALLAAGSLDIARVRPPGPTRQVNEHWVGHYRGWVYGAAFGAQLGAGITTYVTTWGVYATLAAALLTGSPTAGAIVGMVFGFGRSVVLLLTARIDRPSRLTAFHRRMAEIGPFFRRSAAWAIALLGVVPILGVLS